jgi:hypothetical protein
MPAIEVHLSGPLFRADASLKAKQTGENVVRELVETGTKLLAERLQPRPAGVYLSVAEAQKGKASTGNYRRNVMPVLNGLTGRIHDNGIVYGPWLELGGKRFRGYASFRTIGDRLQNEEAPKSCAKWALRLAEELNGGV